MSRLCDIGPIGRNDMDDMIDRTDKKLHGGYRNLQLWQKDDERSESDRQLQALEKSFIEFGGVH